jgi:hypothetical protein
LKNDCLELLCNEFVGEILGGKRRICVDSFWLIVVVCMDAVVEESILPPPIASDSFRKLRKIDNAKDLASFIGKFCDDCLLLMV